MVALLRRIENRLLGKSLTDDQRTRIWVALGGAVLFTGFTGLFATIQYATPGLVGNDGYYHMKMASLMRQDSLTPTFYWLPLSILTPKGYYDHHFLYHIYMMLFVPGSPTAITPEVLTSGAKLASVLMASFAFLAIWWLLRGQKVHLAGLWALGLFAVSDAFLYRVSMPRAQSASLLVLALGMHWFLKRRNILLFLLGFVYVWLYNAFPLLFVMAIAYIFSTYLTEHKLEWQPLVSVALGIGLGLLVNPYFPQNISFIIDHLLPKIGEINESVGNEWYPYETWTLVENSTGALVAAVIGVFALGWSEKRINRPTLFALVLMTGFGFLVFKSRRFIEYFPAFALVFAAMSISRASSKLPPVRSRWLLPAGLVLLMLISTGRTVTRARDLMQRAKPPDLYAAAATWLGENSEPGSLVFQTDWDDFTRLFFYNTTNIYTIGLDVTYMQRFNSELYEEWVDISQGRKVEPSTTIANHFGASFVFSDLKHDRFLEQAEDDPYLVEVYRDEYAVIYEVVQ